MSHLYPIAETAEDALERATLAALTRYDAEALAEGHNILKLETEWITPASDDVVGIMEAADAGPGKGFVQRYEDEKGAPVLAVTYWKLGDIAAKPAKPKPPPSKPSTDEDHTDDLYFRHGRTKPSKRGGRKKFIDPRQMDMFSAPADPED